MTLLPSWLSTITLPMPAALGSVNVYLVHTDAGTALIDTGLQDATSRHALKRALDTKGLSSRDIEAVLLTHYHVDHAGLAAELQAEGAQIIMSGADADMMVEFAAGSKNDERRASLFADHPMPKEMKRRGAKMFAFLRSLGAPVHPDRIVADGEALTLAGLSFHVMATPGHTPGHLALACAEAQVVFTGDCVISPGATHMSGAPDRDRDNPYRGFMNALQRLDGLPDWIAFPGHGRPIRNLSKKVGEVRRHLTASLEGVAKRLTTEPVTALELSRAIDDTRAFPVWLALSQTAAYLTELVETHRAVEERIDGGLHYRRSSI